MANFDIQLNQKTPMLEINLIGKLDEDANLEQISIEGITKIEMNLAQITLLNSCGVRTWVNWGQRVPKEVPVEINNCPRFFVENANMVFGFFPKHFIIKSFEVPYYCESCNSAGKQLIENTGEGVEKSIAKTIVCPKCGKDAEMDVISESYFKFLKPG